MNTNLACGLELPGTLVDKIYFGTANCPEGTNVGALSVTTAAVRNGGGTVDTDNNLADFAIVTGATEQLDHSTSRRPAPRSPPRPSPSARSRPSSASRGNGEGCLTAV